MISSDKPLTERDVVIPSADGSRLHARIWSRGDPRGVVVIAHGLGEHGGAYSHVAEALCESAQVEVIAFDFRGHGRSPGSRGVVRRYEELCDDLRATVAFAATHRPDLPRFALGHSNGGQVVLRSVLIGGLNVSGMILSNPALQVASPIPWWKLEVGRMLRRLAPQVTLETSVNLEMLTRDPVMVELRRTDVLRHSRINGPLFFGLIEGGALIASRAREITLPLLLLLGGSDPVIDAKFTAQFFEQLGSQDKTKWVHPLMLHEPLNELERALPLTVICDWLIERMPRS